MRRILLVPLVVALSVFTVSCSSFLPGDDEAVIEINPPRSGESDTETVVIGEPGVDLTTAEESLERQLRENLPVYPAEWNPRYADLVDFVEATTGHQFRKPWHVLEESDPTAVQDPVRNSREFALGTNGSYRALGIPTTDFAPGAASGNATGRMVYSENLIIVDAAARPVVRDGFLVGMLIAANQRQNRNSRTEITNLDTWFTLMGGETQFVHKRWLQTLSQSAQDEWAQHHVSSADTANLSTDQERWAAKSTVGGAFVEQRYDQSGPDGLAAAFREPLFMVDIVHFDGASTGLNPVAAPDIDLPPGAERRQLPFLGFGHLEAMTGLHTAVPLSQALTAMQEVSTVRDEQWTNEDGQECVGLSLGGWVGRPFDAATTAFGVWADVRPEHRSLSQPGDGQLIVTGCDPGPDAVPDTATFGETIAPLALLIRLETLAMREGAVLACSTDMILATPELTLDDPLLNVPLEELRAQLPERCNDS